MTIFPGKNCPLWVCPENAKSGRRPVCSGSIPFGWWSRTIQGSESFFGAICARGVRSVPRPRATWKSVRPVKQACGLHSVHSLVVPVDSDGGHLRSRDKLFEQRVVTPRIERLRGNIRQVAAEQQVVGRYRVHVGYHALQFCPVEKRVHVDVAEEYGGKAFGVGGGQLDGRVDQLVVRVMRHAVSDEPEGHRECRRKEGAARDGHCAGLQRTAPDCAAHGPEEAPGNVEQQRLAKPYRREGDDGGAGERAAE